METRVAPFLMFQGGDAEAAMELYVATVPGSRVLEVERWGPDGPGVAGQVCVGAVSRRDGTRNFRRSTGGLRSDPGRPDSR